MVNEEINRPGQGSLRRVNNNGFFAGLFWAWNLIFLVFMVLGFGPSVLPDMVRSVLLGWTPPVYLLYGLVLASIPLFAMILGLTILHKHQDRLFRLGYAVEGPLMLVLLIRFFVIREATPAVTLLIILAGIGLGAFLWDVLDPRPAPGRLVVRLLRVAGLTVFLAAALYASLWVLFYAVPVMGMFFRWLGEVFADLPAFFRSFWSLLRDLFLQPQLLVFALLSFIMFVFTATLVVLMPLAVPWMSVRAWLRALQALPGRRGLLSGLAVVLAVTVTIAALFSVALRQPQRQAFDLLETPPASLAEARALVAKTETIRTGLLNAYLAPFRYLSAVGEVVHVRELYRQALNLPEEQARVVQGWYKRMARPCLYEPSTRDEGSDNFAIPHDQQQAADYYQRYFDRNIQQGELDSIVHAVRNTWSGEQAQGAWQAVDEREVLLERQEVTVSEHGDWAEVELFEVYQNQTSQRQEAVYYFTLPESAVITGVWLGNSPERDLRFTYRVSPRGAAQEMYQSQVSARVDPALVEQIGPHQYRLRIFPIEPRTSTMRADDLLPTIIEGQRMYLWLTYQVFAQDGAWPLPVLAEKRNVYWNGSTQRLINGEAVTVRSSRWFPPAAPASASTMAAAHRVDFPTGQSVLAWPPTGNTPALSAAGLRLAVVIDRSYSMRAYAGEVDSALARLRELETAGSTADLYLTASTYRGEQPVSAPLRDAQQDDLFYFGGQNPADLLAQFAQLQNGRQYDAIFVLTDGTGYELGPGSVELPTLQTPIWMVHLGGQLPLGYDDPTLEAIQASSGGITAGLEEALERIAAARTPALDGLPPASLVDGYLWLALPSGQAGAAAARLGALAPDPDFAPLAARRLILAEMDEHQGRLEGLDTLDGLHAIAVKNSIVTPYSSMIVLVTKTQEHWLDQLEKREDRFAREQESIGETPTNQFAVTGVPEPEEWLLIFLAAGMLAWYVVRQKNRRKAGTAGARLRLDQ